MKKVFVYILFVTAANCFSQNSFDDSFGVIEDLNSDDISDTLIFNAYGNTVESVHIYSSISGISYGIGGRGSYNWGSNANFLEIIPLPEELLAPANKHLLDTITHYLLPDFKDTDPSLDWFISGYKTQQIGTTDGLFVLTLQGNLDWKHDTLPYPEASFKLISKDTLPVFWNKVCNEEYIHFKHGILVYYGHNHRSNDVEFVLDTITDNYRIYSTSHGVFAEKNDKYSWLFITNSTLTGGPERLRWRSIRNLKLHNNLLFIHQVSGIGDVNNLFAVNLENGKAGLLRIEDDSFCFNSPQCIDFGVVDSRLVVSSWTDDKVNQVTSSFDLELIMEKLK